MSWCGGPDVSGLIRPVEIVRLISRGQLNRHAACVLALRTRVVGRRRVRRWIDRGPTSPQGEFSGCSRKNDGHDIDDEISMSDPELPYSHSDIDRRTFYHGTKVQLIQIVSLS